MKRDLFLIIDGNSLINRAYYAIPLLQTIDSKPSNAVFGFIKMLIKAINDYSPTEIAVAFDLPFPTFRHIKFKEYKATRKGMPDELALQLPMLKQILSDMQIRIIEKAGYEADDIIGTLCDCKERTLIITGDKDSFQLIDENTSVVFTKRGISDIILYDIDRFRQDYGFEPINIVDYKALAGDTSDNIPGVAGIGIKSASDLIKEYKDIDNIYSNLDGIKEGLRKKLIEGKENAYLSRELAKIERRAEINLCNLDCAFKMPFSNAVRQRLIEYNISSIANQENLFSKENEAVLRAEHIKVNSLNQIKINDTFSIFLEEFKACIGIEGIQYDIDIKDGLLGDGITIHEILEFLKPYLEDRKIEKIVLDAKNLKHKLKAFNIELNNFFDVKLSQYIIDSSAKFNSVTDYGFDENDTAYAINKISKTQKEKMRELGTDSLYYDIELPLVDVLYKMERYGFKLDINLLNTLNNEFNLHLKKISNEIYFDAGEEFNLNSPKQLAVILFEKLKIPYPKKSKSYSTSVDILEPLSKNYPIVARLLEYRKITKLNGTYIEGFKKLADRNGIVHTEFKQSVTATGRLSSIEPNLQNIPIREEEGKRIRSLFIAGENKVLISADYSQIELRLLAHFSLDRVMVNAFKNNQDIHSETASIVFNIPLREVTASMRQTAKAVNFGIIYGISDFGLASNLNLSVKRAREIIDTYFIKFADVKNYLDRCVVEATKKGYASTILNRIRRIPELNSTNIPLKKFGERVAMNTPLQGSAADIIKASMIKIDEDLKEIDARLILQVHDELIIEVDEDKAERAKQILVSGMENIVSLNVPLRVSVGMGKRWIDCK